MIHIECPNCGQWFDVVGTRTSRWFTRPPICACNGSSRFIPEERSSPLKEMLPSFHFEEPIIEEALS